MLFLGIANIFCLSTIFHYFSLPFWKKIYCSNIYPFSWSPEMWTQFCSKRLDFSKVITILLKKNYFRMCFYSQETQRCLAILRNSSSDCFSPFLCYMNISSHYKPEADTQNRSEPRDYQQDEPYHRINSLMKPISELGFVMPLSFKCFYHLKQVELSSISWYETGTGVIARKSFRWLLYLAR